MYNLASLQEKPLLLKLSNSSLAKSLFRQEWTMFFPLSQQEEQEPSPKMYLREMSEEAEIWCSDLL